MKAPYQLLRAARVAIDLSHEDLAREARVSERTLVRIETPQSVSSQSLARVQAALERRGVVFLAETAEGGPGLRVPTNVISSPSRRRNEAGRR